MFSKKRHLTTVPDVSKTVVSGSGLGPKIEPNTTYEVHVQSKDASGDDITTGGYTFKIEIKNKCVSGITYTCTPVGNATSALTSDISDTMTDNGDGTYNYSYSVPNTGAVTVVVSMVEAPGIYAEYYDNDNWSGDVVHTEVIDEFDLDWKKGDLLPGIDDEVTINFFTYLTPKVTDSYLINIKHDDGSTLKIDGVPKISKAGSN